MTKIRLMQTQAPTASASAFSATLTTVIDAAMVCNPTGADDTLSVWIVPDGETAADATAIYSDLAVAAGESVSLSLLINQSLAKADEIHLKAGTSATALTVTMSGRTG